MGTRAPNGRREHSPQWPPYVPNAEKYPQRTLAIMETSGRWLSEHGEIATPATWREATDLLYAWDAHVWCGPLEIALHAWLPDILAEMRDIKQRKADKVQWCELHVAPDSAALVSVTAWRLVEHENGRHYWNARHITIASVWAGARPEPSLLPTLRALFDLCGVGVRGTPASLGHARMVHAHTEAELPRYYRPARDCIAVLERETAGSRKETYYPEAVYDQAYELDKTSGYASQAHTLPAGTAGYMQRAYLYLISFESGVMHFALPPLMFAAFVRATIRITAPGLAPGDVAPFACRDLDGGLRWPTAPGEYDTWLWDFELAEIDRRCLAGDSILIARLHEGYYWPTSTDQLAGWALGMDQLRRAAAATPDGKRLASLVKLATVGGIGRLGMPYQEYSVLHEDDSEVTDRQLPSAYLPDSKLYIRQAACDIGYPKHWHSYILSRMNFDLYLAMRREIQRGNTIIASNVDALYVTQAPGEGVAPAAAAMGDYKLVEIAGYFAAPSVGVILAPGKVATPGLAAERRQRLMRLGEGTGGGNPRRQRTRASAGNELRAHLRQPDIYAELEALRKVYLKRANG